MIESARRFVATTDEVWRLQRGEDAECRFFQAMANQGHFGGKEGSTRQGIYVCAPSGKFLGSILSHRPSRVIAMLDKAWKKWESLPPEERSLSELSQIRPSHRWEDSYPEDGLVLSMFTRDLPLDCDPTSECRKKWNRDFVWYSKGEARQWLPPEPAAGKEWELPPRLTDRLARYHLVDVVRGQTSPMSASQVAGSKIIVRVQGLSGDLVHLEITGNTTSESKGRKLSEESERSQRRRGRDTEHGVTANLLGTATFDLSAEKFVAFEFVALGARWGQTRFNGRYWDSENSSPVGYVFQLAGPSTPQVAPGFVAFYEADWLTRPAEQD